ncbi:hypothetical protein PoB_003562600 [Plakobranchus ocellatus]|uniref:Uncharacterized protein n=1 Tax=Plakobranchus ocellatus TaxID=259542 RepID=A0AAV4ARD5_9GAST|nr:hypothetical protein PoB_003562600 [Plakobranchus ocellatus]
MPRDGLPHAAGCLTVMAEKRHQYGSSPITSRDTGTRGITMWTLALSRDLTLAASDPRKRSYSVCQEMDCEEGKEGEGGDKPRDTLGS